MPGPVVQRGPLKRLKSVVLAILFSLSVRREAFWKKILPFVLTPMRRRHLSPRTQDDRLRTYTCLLSRMDAILNRRLQAYESPPASTLSPYTSELEDGLSEFEP